MNKDDVVHLQKRNVGQTLAQGWANVSDVFLPFNQRLMGDSCQLDKLKGKYILMAGRDVSPRSGNAKNRPCIKCDHLLLKE